MYTSSDRLVQWMASAAGLPPSATSRSRHLPGQSSGQRSWGRAGVWHFASQPSSRASSAVPRVPPPMPGPRARQEWRTALGGTPGPFGVLHGFESGSFAMLPVRGHRSAYMQARMTRSPRGIWESLGDSWSILSWLCAAGRLPRAFTYTTDAHGTSCTSQAPIDTGWGALCSPGWRSFRVVTCP